MSYHCINPLYGQPLLIWKYLDNYFLENTCNKNLTMNIILSINFQKKVADAVEEDERKGLHT